MPYLGALLDTITRVPTSAKPGSLRIFHFDIPRNGRTLENRGFREAFFNSNHLVSDQVLKNDHNDINDQSPESATEYHPRCPTISKTRKSRKIYDPSSGQRSNVEMCLKFIVLPCMVIVGYYTHFRNSAPPFPIPQSYSLPPN